MKALRTLLFLFVLNIFANQAYSQADSAKISERAILNVESMLDAYRYGNLEQYINMSCAGVIKYYGGKKGYGEYVQRARAINMNDPGEPKEKTELIQLVSDAISEWQCVIRKTRETLIDNKKAFVISYLVGQSKDEGQNWKFFDVAFNSVENVIYIMPDIFDTLAIPQRQVIFEKDHMVSHP